MTEVVALALVGVSFTVSGGWLFARRKTPVAATWLTLGGATLALGEGVEGSPGSVLTQTALLVLLPLALVTYPRVSRHPVDLAALGAVVVVGGAAVGWRDPDAATGAGFLVAGLLLVHAWWRLERSARPQRQALAWPYVALGVALLVVFVAAFAAGETWFPLTLASFALAGPAFVVGAARPEILDVRGLVVGLVVGVVVLLSYLACFVLALAGLAALGEPDPPPGTLGLVGAALAFGVRPGQQALRGIVDQVLFGHRPDPLGAARQVVGHVGDDPADALRGIREALVLPYVAWHRPDGTVLASGEPVPHVRTLPLEGVGDLVVGLRPGDLALARQDALVLQIAGPLLAQSLRAGALAAQLNESRAATITAVEEERRRLRRDLHDGLGPQLTGIAYAADAARNLLRSDPDSVEQLLVTVRADTGRAIEDVRGLVYGMRPPALDELGLVAALRQQALALRSGDGEPVAVEVVADHVPARLGAATEVAAYRIVTEALANVARHSGSQVAKVVLRGAGDQLVVEVTDCGRARVWGSGVGTASMRERAAELGGTLEAGPGPEGGHVRAVLPILGAAVEDAGH